MLCAKGLAIFGITIPREIIDLKQRSVLMMSSSSGGERPGRQAAEQFVEPKFQARIGQKLREYYDQISSEPVPDRFKALLDQLASAEGADTGTRSASQTGEAE